MLEWTSDAWGKLMGPHGTGEKVPALLQQLMGEYDQEIADELFQEYLFHQNTIYTVTYAAVPYLTQMARSTTDPEVRRDLFVTCGVIEASRDRNEAAPFPAAWAGLAEQVGASVCSDIYDSYIEAIREMAYLGEDVRAHAADAPVDESEKRYILLADAAYRGAHPVANMLMTFSSGDEYVAVCPACEQDVYLWPNGEGGRIQAFAEDPVFEEEQEAYEVVPTAKFADADQKTLAKHAAAIGEHGLARDLPYLAGEANCPSCGKHMQIWPALLSTFSG